MPTDVPGAVEIANTLKPLNGQQYPVALAEDVAGGYQTFLTTADRNAFDARKLVLHMLCFVAQTSKTFRLTSLSPVVWTEEASGGVSSVNGATGDVVLNAGDVGADPAGTASGLVSALEGTLGNSATRDVGTTAGTVAAGDDARLIGNEKSANKGAANGYAGLNADGQVELSQIVLSTSDCGSGIDGDIDVSTSIYMSRDMRYRRIRMLPGGKIFTDMNTNVASNWVLRAQILDLTESDPYCLAGKLNNSAGGDGQTSGTAGSNGSAASYYGGTAGGGTRAATGGAGGGGVGGAGGAGTSATCVGGYSRRPGGAGGASVSAGGAGGVAGTGSPGVEPTVPCEPALQWSESAAGGSATTTANGGAPGAGGGGGGGDGTGSAAGGGAGGPGTKPLDVRVGRLIVGPLTGLPIVDGRGGRGGRGGDAAGSNRGGGGGGAGGCGTRIHLSVGEIALTGGATLPFVGALDASGGAGGAGGDGTGAGGGGFGGGGGGGGAIYYRRRGGAILDLDDRASLGDVGGAPSGSSGGTGGAGRATLGDIS